MSSLCLAWRHICVYMQGLCAHAEWNISPRVLLVPSPAWCNSEQHYLLSWSDGSLLSLPPSSPKPCVTSLALSLGAQGATWSRDRNCTASQCEPDCSFWRLIFLGSEWSGLDLTLYTRIQPGSNRNVQKACCWAAIEAYPQACWPFCGWSWSGSASLPPCFSCGTWKLAKVYNPILAFPGM